MKNIKSIIQYECMTSFKPIWIFYAIQYTAITFATILIGLIEGSIEGVGVSYIELNELGINCIELNTLVYICVIGVFGYKEDFKMLIQNGFTRKYIFIATITMFCFIAGIMAFVDTIVGQFLHHMIQNYSSIYGSIYGYDHLFINWLWLFLMYVILCCFMYFISLVFNKMGKTLSICFSVISSGILLLFTVLFRYACTGETVNNILVFFMKAMGFMADGTINYIMPLLTLCILGTCMAAGAYVVLRRTELR